MQSSSSEFLQRLSGAIADVAEGASLSVVSVGFEGRTGTGAVVDKEGHVLTASHVVRRLDRVEVGTTDGRLEGRIVGKNTYADLALVKVEGAGLKPLEFAMPGALKVGQFLLAMARQSSAAVSVTSGIVTAVNRPVNGWWRFSIPDAIVTDARLNPGYSGGPLVDAQGRMVGMNVAYLMNRGIAVPIDTIRRSLDRMSKGESVKRAYLGVVSAPIELPDELAALPDVGQGSALMVLSVERESAAKRAGLALGDVLLRFGGQMLAGTQDLEGALDEEAIGKETKLTVLRGEQLRELTVTPSSR